MKKIFTIIAIALPVLFTSCLKDALYEGPSNIDSIALSPEAPTSNDAVTVTATVSGVQKVTKASLTYNGTALEMSGSGKTFTATVPAQPDKTVVEVVVSVTNAAGYTATANKSYTVGNPPVDFTKLVLNELYGAGEDNEKSIELYNCSDFAIDLEGVTLNKDEELTWTGIKGESCPAHGVFAIVGAKKTTERGISSGFSAKKSVIIELFDPSGNKLDTFQRGEKGTGWGNQGLTNNKGSWSRIPDGTGKFQITEEVTIGALNSKTGTEDPDVVQ